MNKRQTFTIIIVIAIGAILAGLILVKGKTSSPEEGGNSGKADAAHAPHPGHDEDEATGDHDHENEGESTKTVKSVSSEASKGPKGGKLFTKDKFGVEVTIFEQGVPPQLRLYLYENGKPLPPSAARVTVTLSRLGVPAQVFNFKPTADFLLGDQVVDEPHSFDMVIAAERNGKVFRWGYTQVESRVEIPEETLKSIGVEVRTAGPTTLNIALKLPGEIGFDEQTIVRVVPRLPGLVTQVYGQYGQLVQKGEVLAVIESAILADLRSQLLASQKRFDLARITYEREKQLWEEKISAKQDYLAADQALSEAQINVDLGLAKLRNLGINPQALSKQSHLARYEVRAPNFGLITARAIAQGQILKEDTEIFTIADISTVWSQITVYANDLESIELGQKANVRSTATDAQGEGSISYISPLIGAQTRTTTARVVLENKDGRWRPGMFVTAELAIANVEVPLAVTANAIQTLNDHSVVFGRYDKYFEARPLKLGRSDGQMVEVLGGLAPGDQYAAENSYAIKAELGKDGASHSH